MLRFPKSFVVWVIAGMVALAGCGNGSKPVSAATPMRSTRTVTVTATVTAATASSPSATPRSLPTPVPDVPALEIPRYQAVGGGIAQDYHFAPDDVQLRRGSGTVILSGHSKWWLLWAYRCPKSGVQFNLYQGVNAKGAQLVGVYGYGANETGSWDTDADWTRKAFTGTQAFTVIGLPRSCTWAVVAAK